MTYHIQKSTFVGSFNLNLHEDNRFIPLVYFLICYVSDNSWIHMKDDGTWEWKVSMSYFFELNVD